MNLLERAAWCYTKVVKDNLSRITGLVDNKKSDRIKALMNGSKCAPSLTIQRC